jgi:rhamnulokinase
VNSLAFDLGASGGKLFFGTFDGKKITIREFHRFANHPVERNGHLVWDIQKIYSNLLLGLRKASAEEAACLGIDSFCNDYGILDKRGNLISPIYMYRDKRTEGVLERIDENFAPETLYQRTGCQRARFNTLGQLVAQALSPERKLIQKADKLLFVPDLLNFWLCGKGSTEFTIASVSQLFNRNDNQWDSEILRAFDLPEQIFPKVVLPAGKLGAVKKEILDQSGLSALSIFTVGHHDTASAVVAVPGLDNHFAYISSGSWSLIGTETSRMITSEGAFRENFANEGGVGNTNRFIKNVNGLWLLQEFQRQLRAQKVPRTFAELEKEAQAAKPFRSIIDPNDACFFDPGDIVEKIQAFCHESTQPIPETICEVTRCIQESLALAYRDTIEKMEELTGWKFPCVHVIGGGARNTLLNRMAASAMNKPILAGPFEATAIGNLCAQFMAAGEIKSLKEARSIIRSSFKLREYLPENSPAWDAAYVKFQMIRNREI